MKFKYKANFNPDKKKPSPKPGCRCVTKWSPEGIAQLQRQWIELYNVLFRGNNNVQ